MKNNGLKNAKAITLIAMIVTIIVLLILAGVSIAVLTGENGILNRATEAKTTSAIAQFKEDARLEHLAQQVEKQAYGTAFSYSKLINELKKKGYTIVQPATASNQEIDSITLASNQGNVEANGSITVDVDIEYSVTGENGYYVYLEGKYYALTPSNTNGLEVANTASDIEVGGGQQGNAVITAVSDKTGVATASVSGNTITINGVNGATKGQEATITVQVNGEDFANNEIAVKIVALSTVNSVNVSTLTIDGASLITATLSDNTIATSEDVTWSTSDASKVSVTSNGIVKCGTSTGTATITCSGANSSSATVSVTSLAKIVYTNSGSANTTITGAITGFAYNNPIIPVGFSAIDTNNAKWNLSADKKTANPEYNNGLVIMDEKGNQFVWVPVGEPNNDSNKVINYAKWCTKGTSNTDTSDETPVATDTTTTYGGFWIGRYEAGLDVNAGSSFQKTANKNPRNGTYTPIIVEGAIPWNYIDYTNAKTNAESVYTNTSYAQSGLVNGTQWDTALKFIKVKADKDPDNSTTWGNHYDTGMTSIDRFPLSSSDNGVSWSARTSKTASSYFLLRTGATTQTQVLNISDMTGNVWEWISEYPTSNSSDRVYRGGSYFNNGSSGDSPASYRGSVTASSTGSKVRFPRSALHKVELNTDKGGLSSQ